MLKTNLLKKIILLVLVIAIVILTAPIAYARDISSEDGSATAEKAEEDLQLGRYTETDVIAPEAFAKSVLVDNIIHDSSKGVEDLKAAILQKKVGTEGLSKKTEIDNVGYFSSAVKRKYPEMSDWDLGKTVLLALGDSEEFIATLPEDKVLEASGYTSVIRTESYFKETAKGGKIELSEEEYYSEIASIENEEKVKENGIVCNNASRTAASQSSSPVYDMPEVLDSYIKLTTTAYKTNPSYSLPGRNYFTIRGEVEWTKSPAFQRKDVLAIASTGNVDGNYDVYAHAYWTLSSYSISDTAYIGQNGGKGEVYGDKLKIYNPSIYGVAVDVQVGFPDGPALKNVYAYYGIVTQNDVSCQVGYAHSTLGLSDPSVSIDSSGSISFSVGVLSTMEKYFGRAFTLYHESYLVSLNTPSDNATIACSSTAPTFRWTLQSGLPQNFILEIDYLKSGSYMSIQTTNDSHTLSAANWNKIVHDSPFTGNVKEIRWRIRINYVTYPDQQPYYSAWNMFTVTGVPLSTQEILPTIFGSTRYMEKVFNLSAGGYKDFYVTFGTSGNKVLQTFGTKDTKLELYSASGALLASDDDDGYSSNALLSYNFTAGVQYKIRVKFYSTQQSGTTKLAIVPAPSVNSYEDIYDLNDYTMGLTWNFSQNNVRLLTYTYSTTRDLTMHVDSEVDTYLYIIDPRSTDVIRSASIDSPDSTKGYNNLYNDDIDGANDRNSQITKTFEAGVPYLVMVSAYNPSLSSSVGSFYVNFPPK